MRGTFAGQKLTVNNVTVNSYTHAFKLQLPRLTQQVCGEELQVTATGYNGTLTDKTKIFVENCKYDYYYSYDNLILVFVYVFVCVFFGNF